MFIWTHVSKGMLKIGEKTMQQIKGAKSREAYYAISSSSTETNMISILSRSLLHAYIENKPAIQGGQLWPFLFRLEF